MPRLTSTNHVQVLVVCAGLLIACNPKPVSVPPGFTPLEEVNKAALPTGSAEDPHPEKMNTVKGHDADLELDWAHGQGYIHASLDTVWKAMQDPCVVVKHEDLQSFCVSAVNPDKEAHASFHMHFVAKPVGTQFDAGWRQFATKGTRDKPEEVTVRDDLLHTVDIVPGTTVMTTVSDSVVLTGIDASTVSIASMRHLQVADGSPEKAEEYVTTLFANLLSAVHGGSLCPTRKSADDATLQCH